MLNKKCSLDGLALYYCNDTLVTLTILFFAFWISAFLLPLFIWWEGGWSKLWECKVWGDLCSSVIYFIYNLQFMVPWDICVGTVPTKHVIVSVRKKWWILSITVLEYTLLRLPVKAFMSHLVTPEIYTYHCFENIC